MKYHAICVVYAMHLFSVISFNLNSPMSIEQNLITFSGVYQSHQSINKIGARELESSRFALVFLSVCYAIEENAAMTSFVQFCEKISNKLFSLLLSNEM